MQDEKELYEKARRRVKKIRDFYSNVFSYVVISTFLTLLNWYTNPDHWWVQWVWFGWGFGVAMHGIGLYKTNILFGEDWEEKKIKEEIEKMKRQS